MAHSGSDAQVVDPSDGRRGRKRKLTEERGHNRGHDSGGSPSVEPGHHRNTTGEVDEKLNLILEAHNAKLIIAPVSICMAIVIGIVSLTTNYHEGGDMHVVYRHTRFHEKSSDVINWNASAFAALLLVAAVIIAVSVYLIFTDILARFSTISLLSDCL